MEGVAEIRMYALRTVGISQISSARARRSGASQWRGVCSRCPIRPSILRLGASHRHPEAENRTLITSSAYQLEADRQSIHAASRDADGGVTGE